MGYLLIALSAVMIAAQVSFAKIYQNRYAAGTKSYLFYSLILNVSMLIMFLVINNFNLHFSLYSVLMALLLVIGVLNTLLVVVAVKFGKMAVFSSYNMLGAIILPFIFGIFALKEEVTLYKILGICLLVLSLVLPALKQSSKGQKTSVKFLILCLLSFAINGLVSIISKAHQINDKAIPTNDFLVWTYLFSSIFVAAIFFGYSLKHKNTPIFAEKNNAKSWVLIISLIALIAIISGVGYLVQLQVAVTVPASILFPLLSGLSIILTAISGKLFFKESITKFDIMCLFLTLSGSVLFIF